MTWYSIVSVYFLVVPHALLILIAISMARNGRYRDFPIFFTYTLFEVLSFGVLMFSLHWWKPPFPVLLRIDMFARAGSAAMRFAILKELFDAPLANNAMLHRTMARILNWTTALLSLLSVAYIGLTYYSTPGMRLMPDYITIEAFNVAQCGLVVLVFLWHRFLGIRMSACAFGIALGLGLVAGMEPLIFVLKDSFIPRYASMTVDIVQMATYHVAVLIWLYFVHARETSNIQPVPPNVQDWPDDLRRVTQL